jgi:ADP-ribosylglycohydrolase
MENIAHEGGDTVINCQIAGTILGSYLGHKKLPSEWISKLEHQELANELAAALRG